MPTIHRGATDFTIQIQMLDDETEQLQKINLLMRNLVEMIDVYTLSGEVSLEYSELEQNILAQINILTERVTGVFLWPNEVLQLGEGEQGIGLGWILAGKSIILAFGAIGVVLLTLMRYSVGWLYSGVAKRCESLTNRFNYECLCFFLEIHHGESFYALSHNANYTGRGNQDDTQVGALTDAINVIANAINAESVSFENLRMICRNLADTETSYDIGLAISEPVMARDRVSSVRGKTSATAATNVDAEKDVSLENPVNNTRAQDAPVVRAADGENEDETRSTRPTKRQ